MQAKKDTRYREKQRRRSKACGKSIPAYREHRLPMALPRFNPTTRPTDMSPPYSYPYLYKFIILIKRILNKIKVFRDIVIDRKHISAEKKTYARMYAHAREKAQEKTGRDKVFLPMMMKSASRNRCAALPVRHAKSPPSPGNPASAGTGGVSPCLPGTPSTGRKRACVCGRAAV